MTIIPAISTILFTLFLLTLLLRNPFQNYIDRFHEGIKTAQLEVVQIDEKNILFTITLSDQTAMLFDNTLYMYINNPAISTNKDYYCSPGNEPVIINMDNRLACFTKREHFDKLFKAEKGTEKIVYNLNRIPNVEQFRKFIYSTYIQ
jgi:hypothetical protein